MQTVDENENLLSSIIDENEQWQNEVRKTVEEIVKVAEKNIEIDSDVYEKICKENYELKQEVKRLTEHVQLTQKVLVEDQLKALKTGNTKGSKWSEETILKGLGLRFTCGTTGYNYIREIIAPFPSVRTL